MQSFDSLMIVEIYVEIYKEVIYVLYTAKKIDENKINIYLRGSEINGNIKIVLK